MLSQAQLNELEKAIDKQVSDERQWQYARGVKDGDALNTYLLGYAIGMRKMLAVVRNIKGESNE